MTAPAINTANHHPEPPIGKRHPVTSAERQTYIDTGKWPDAGKLLPRPATQTELAERLARATQLLGEPHPIRCEGERDANDRACCLGDDVRRVTYTPDYDDGPFVALWCRDCRAKAKAWGAIIVRLDAAA